MRTDDGSGAAVAARDAFADAIRFFTRLPVPEAWGARSTERIYDGVAVAAPVAGAAAGAAAGLGLAACIALQLPPLVAAVFASAIGLAVTGALHLDGLADVADGFGGGATRERKLAIMRDSRLGTYGAAALGLALLARVALIAALAERSGLVGALLGLVAAAALARPLALLPTQLLEAARSDGMGSAVRPKRRFVAYGVTLGAISVLALCGPISGAIAVLAALGAGLGVVALARAQIGGYTGDVCGAAAECAEIAALAALVAVAAID